MTTFLHGRISILNGFCQNWKEVIFGWAGRNPSNGDAWENEHLILDKNPSLKEQKPIFKRFFTNLQ
jgi:hypothetical protein